MSKIPPNTPPKQPNNPIKQTPDSIRLSHLGRSIQVPTKLMKETTKKTSKNAADFGETNDSEAYCDEMEDTFLRVFRKKKKH